MSATGPLCQLDSLCRQSLLEGAPAAAVLWSGTAFNAEDGKQSGPGEVSAVHWAAFRSRHHWRSGTRTTKFGKSSAAPRSSAVSFDSLPTRPRCRGSSTATVRRRPASSQRPTASMRCRAHRGLGTAARARRALERRAAFWRSGTALRPSAANSSARAASRSCLRRPRAAARLAACRKLRRNKGNQEERLHLERPCLLASVYWLLKPAQERWVSACQLLQARMH